MKKNVKKQLKSFAKNEIRNTKKIKGGDGHLIGGKTRQKPKPRVWIYSGR